MSSSLLYLVSSSSSSAYPFSVRSLSALYYYMHTCALILCLPYTTICTRVPLSSLARSLRHSALSAYRLACTLVVSNCTNHTVSYLNSRRQSRRGKRLALAPGLTRAGKQATSTRNTCSVGAAAHCNSGLLRSENALPKNIGRSSCLRLPGLRIGVTPDAPVAGNAFLHLNPAQ